MIYIVFQVLWVVSIPCSIVSLVSGSDASAGRMAGSICGALCALVLVFMIKAHILHLEMLRRLLSFRRYLVAGITFLGMQLSSVASALVLDVSRCMREPRANQTRSSLIPYLDQLSGESSYITIGLWPCQNSPMAVYPQSERLVCLVQITLALACMIVANMSTYGVTGYVLHRFMPAVSSARSKSSQDESGSWSFFQPFKVRHIL